MLELFAFGLILFTALAATAYQYLPECLDYLGLQPVRRTPCEPVSSKQRERVYGFQV